MPSVILLEDDVLLSIVQKKMLESIGCTVIATSTNGEEGLEKIESLNPEIVVSDQNLLGSMTGLDVVSSLRSKGNTLPFIILSGDTTLDYLRSTEKFKNLEPLAKPVDIAELKTILKKFELSLT